MPGSTIPNFRPIRDELYVKDVLELPINAPDSLICTPDETVSYEPWTVGRVLASGSHATVPPGEYVLYQGLSGRPVDYDAFCRVLPEDLAVATVPEEEVRDYINRLQFRDRIAI